MRLLSGRDGSLRLPRRLIAALRLGLLFENTLPRRL